MKILILDALTLHYDARFGNSFAKGSLIDPIIISSLQEIVAQSAARSMDSFYKIFCNRFVRLEMQCSYI